MKERGKELSCECGAREDENKGGACLCAHRTKKRDEAEYKRLINRLKRIEGQIRGISKMVESDAYCNDILIQLSAVQSAISSFAGELFDSHIKSCVVSDIKAGKNETADELVKTVKRFIK